MAIKIEHVIQSRDDDFMKQLEEFINKGWKPIWETFSRKDGQYELFLINHDQ